MPREKAARRFALLAFGALVLADIVAVALMEGRMPPIVQWPIQGAAAALIVAYFVFYVREHPLPRVQFGIVTIMAIVTLAAFDAWAWRTNLGPLVTALIVTGLLLYWRIWLRRYEQLGWLSISLVLLLTFFFFWLGLILVGLLFEPPKPTRTTSVWMKEPKISAWTLRRSSHRFAAVPPSPKGDGTADRSSLS
jgi:hypothetical protein